jgi:serine/threonine protein phosphatase 1
MKPPKTFILGDIHGRLKALQQVFERCEFDFENDSLIFLGDIVDRGEEPFECIAFLDRVQNKTLIQGNHDQVFYQYMQTGHDGFNGQHGAHITKRLWQANFSKEERELIFDFFKSQIEYYVDLQNNCFVHGGFDRDFLIREQTGISYLCWDRELFKKAMGCKSGQKLKTKDNFNEIFIGHTPTVNWTTKEEVTSGGIVLPKGIPITLPIHTGGVWNLDTGAGFDSGKLTIMNLENHEIFQSDSIKDLYNDEK